MAEFSAIAQQTVNPGESVIFTATPVNNLRNFVRHNDETGVFLLSGNLPFFGGCPCCRQDIIVYPVSFGANIAVPTGETVGEISVAIAVDGVTDPASVMRVTPAAVEQFFNVSRDKDVEIWRGCCQSISVRNTSTIPILVQEATIDIEQPTNI